MEVELSLAHTLRELGVRRSLLLRFLRSGGSVRPPPAASFFGGMEALPRALGRSLGAKLVLDAPVRRLRRHGAGWSVLTDGGCLAARAVVLTIPATQTAALLECEAPGAASALRELRYNRLAVVHLDAAAPRSAMGFQVALSERSRLLRGVTFNECLFGRSHLCTAYVGGSGYPELGSMTEDAIAGLAVADFRACTGRDARVLAVEHARMPAWDRSWRSLERVQLPPGLHVAANWWSRPGVGARVAEAERLARRIAAGA
jgi:protoporphyrinogen oxidase